MFLDNFSCIVFIANISILYELPQKQGVKQVIAILTRLVKNCVGGAFSLNKFIKIPPETKLLMHEADYQIHR